MAYKVEITEELSEINNGSERLNDLATLCIEKKLLDDIDIDPIIVDFASRIVRRNFKGNMYKLFYMHTDLDAFECYQ